MNGPLFIANLAAVVLALGFTVHAGVTHRRRRHISLALSSLVLLCLAILQAEFIGRGYFFPAGRLRIHLGLAIAALVTVPGVAWSGYRLHHGRVQRPVHRRWVGVFLGLTVLAVLSALWMFVGAEPRRD